MIVPLLASLLALCHQAQDEPLKRSLYPAAPGWEWTYEASGRRSEDADLSKVERLRRAMEKKTIEVGAKKVKWDTVEVVTLERRGDKETEVAREYVAVDATWTRLFLGPESNGTYRLEWGLAHDFLTSGRHLVRGAAGEEERKVDLSNEQGEPWFPGGQIKVPGGEFATVKKNMMATGGGSRVWFAAGTGIVQESHYSGPRLQWDFKLKALKRP